MTAERIASHADDVLEVLQALAKLLGERGRPADLVIEMVRASLAALIGENTPNDPDVIRQLAADLRDQLAGNDARVDADLAAKFDHGGDS